MNDTENKHQEQNNTNTVKFVEKKGKRINQKPRNTKTKEEKEKISIRNIIWIIAIFIIMFSILIALPYISNYR